MYIIPYNRNAAINYAKKWALSRNPSYYNYDGIGGDCTNFISQCIYAGIGVMNYTKDLGWYYSDPNNKSPAWTGVRYLYNFLVTNKGVGPFGERTDLSKLQLGDIIQISRDGVTYKHSTILTRIDNSNSDSPKYYVCAHTLDVLEKNLYDYEYKSIRCIHIINGRKA